MLNKLDKTFKVCGWVMCAAIALLIINYLLPPPYVTGKEDSKFTKTAQTLAGNSKLTAKTIKIDNKNIPYFISPNGNYVISTEHLTPDIIGYAERIDTAIVLSSKGKILKLKIYSHKETPGFFKRAMPITKKLIGLQVPADAKPADIISGATYTSRAITESVYNSAATFMQAVNKKSSTTAFAYNKKHLICLSFIACLALLPFIRLLIKKKRCVCSGFLPA